MGFFHEYPYTDAHELNLDWIIAKVQAMETQISNFVSHNTVKYADPIRWDITKDYQANTVVVDGTTGDAYISTKAVPANVLLSDTDYWSVIFNYDYAIQQEATLRNIEDTKLLNNINNLMSPDIEDGDTSSKAYAVGNYILWKNLLYIVTVPVSLGDPFSTSTNLARVYVGEKFEELDKGRGRRFLFIGDSYAAGQNAVDQTTIEGFYSKAASFMHLTTDEYFIIANGGHGFTSNGVATNKFLADVQAKIGEMGDLSTFTDIIVCAGWNDYQADQDDIESDIEAFVNYCNTTFTNASISIGFISYGFLATYIPQMLHVQQAYSRCGVYNCKYIDNIEYVLHNIGLLHAVDHYHPNADGQTALANALVSWIQGGDINVVYPVDGRAIIPNSGDTLNYGNMIQGFKNNQVIIFPSNISINFGTVVTATSHVIGSIERKYFTGITGYTSIPVKGYIYGSIGTAGVCTFNGSLNINDGELSLTWNYPVVNGALVTSFSISAVQFSIDTTIIDANLS